MFDFRLAGRVLKLLGVALLAAVIVLGSLLALSVGTEEGRALADVALRGKLQCFTSDGNCVEAWNGTDITVYSDEASTLEFQVDGATGLVDFAGGQLDLDADNDTSITADTDDQIDIEIGGSDAYSMTASSFYLAANTLTLDADQDTTLEASFDDVITITLGAATGRVDLLTGNFAVGNGMPGTSLNGEDAYIEGGLEVDGTARLDGTVNAAADVDIGTFLNLSAQSTISLTEGSIITPTGAYQPLTTAAAGAACDTSTCVASGGETGDLLILHNINATGVITLDGTGGTVECKADVNLDAGDTISFIWNGSAWNCLASYDNS
jgi:hypothetical protein